MTFEYKVETFVPNIKGCAAKDNGWDQVRCQEFQDFLNKHAKEGWKLNSQEYRQVTMTGCLDNKGAWLVCVFERTRN